MNNTTINSSNVVNLFKSIFSRLQLTGLVLSSFGFRGVSYKDTQQKYAGGFVAKILPSVGISLPEVGTLTIGPELNASVIITKTEVKDVHISKELSKKIDSMMQYARIITSPSDPKSKIIEIAKVEKITKDFFTKEMDQYNLSFEDPTVLPFGDMSNSPKLKKDWDALISENSRSTSNLKKGWVFILGHPSNVEEFVATYNTDPRFIPDDLKAIVDITNYDTKPVCYYFLDTKPASLDATKWKDTSDIKIGKNTSGMEFHLLTLEKKKVPLTEQEKKLSKACVAAQAATKAVTGKVIKEPFKTTLAELDSMRIKNTYTIAEYETHEKFLGDLMTIYNNDQKADDDKLREYNEFLNNHKEKFIPKIAEIKDFDPDQEEHALKPNSILTHDKIRSELHRAMKTAIKANTEKITLDEQKISVSPAEDVTSFMESIANTSLNLPYQREDIKPSDIALGSIKMNVGDTASVPISSIYVLEDTSVYRTFGLFNMYQGFVVSAYVNKSLFDLIHGLGVNVQVNLSEYLGDAMKKWISHYVSNRKQERITTNLDYSTAKTIARRMGNKEFANFYLEIAGRNKSMKPLESSDWADVSTADEDAKFINEITNKSNKIGFVLFFNILRGKALNITFALPFFNGSRLADHYSVDVSIVFPIYGMPLGGYDYFSMDSTVAEIIEGSPRSSGALAL